MRRRLGCSKRRSRCRPRRNVSALKLESGSRTVHLRAPDRDRLQRAAERCLQPDRFELCGDLPRGDFVAPCSGAPSLEKIVGQEPHVSAQPLAANAVDRGRNFAAVEAHLGLHSDWREGYEHKRLPSRQAVSPATLAGFGNECCERDCANQIRCDDVNHWRPS